MILSIHQPHFLPWMGYFNKVLQSEVFVWLHSVQYRKNYYQNRTKIKNVNEAPLWLTLPVHAKLGIPIDQVTLADPRWRERVSKTVTQCYCKAPYFDEVWEVINDAMTSSSDNLSDVNFRTFSAVLGLLRGEQVRVELASNLPASSPDPTLRLVELCTAAGGKTYIAGKGGHNYLRVEEFERAGIRVIWQDFVSDGVTYKQSGKVFVPGLSIVDCLFNVGPAAARELTLNAWKPPL
jgi:hypothetical protein